jgi:hypothetical protein
LKILDGAETALSVLKIELNNIPRADSGSDLRSGAVFNVKEKELTTLELVL